MTDSDDPAKASGPNDLNKLIETMKEANGWSDEDVAARSRQHGYDTSKSNIARLRTERVVESVSRRQVESLSAALRVAPENVLNAFLSSMGYAPRPKSSVNVETALAADLRLTAGDRDALLVLYKFMVRRAKN